MTATTVPLAGLSVPRLRLHLLRMALPAMFGSLVGMLAQFAIVAALGRMGDEALYLQSLYMPFFLLFAAVQMAIEVTNAICVALAYGRSDRPAIGSIASGAMGVGLLILLCLAGAVALLAPTLAGVLGVRAESMDLFVSFMRWTALAQLPNIASIVFASGLRACQRPRTAALNSIAIAASRVAGVLALGVAGGLGVFSVPLSIAASGTLGAALGWWAWRRSGIGTVRPAMWHGARAIAPTLLTTGIPVAAGLLMTAAASAGALRLLDRFGPTVVSGYSAAQSLQNVITVPAIALGSACGVLINNLRGEQRPDRLPDAWKVATQATLVTYSLIAVLAWLARAPLAGLVSDSPAVVAEVERYLTAVALTYSGVGLFLVMRVILEQLRSGALSLALQATLFLTTLLAGGWLAHRMSSVSAFYAVIAVANLIWPIPATVLALTVIRRQAT